MAEKRAYFFDLDGTLIDPKMSITRCINYALERQGYDPRPTDDLKKYIGFHLEHVFSELCNRREKTFLWDCIWRYRERFHKDGIAENRVYPGIKNMLQSLQKQTNFIVSIKPTDGCEAVLKHLGLTKYFQRIYGSESDGTRSNKSELIAYILTKEKIDHAVMIGDRATDIQAGKSHGLGTIGVTYGFGAKKEIVGAGPDRIAHSTEELKKFLIA